MARRPQGMAIDLGALLGGPPPDERTPEQKLEARRKAFNNNLDAALNGTCPGEADPLHAAVTSTLRAFLQATQVGSGLLPEPVQDAMVKVVAHEVIHNENEGGWPAELQALLTPAVQNITLLVAGAVLRVANQAETAGIKLSTGNYL